METLQLVMSIILGILSLFLIGVVLLQESKSSGLPSGAIGGGESETFFSKHKSRSYEGRLAFLTKASAIGFVIISIGLVFIQKYQ